MVRRRKEEMQKKESYSVGVRGGGRRGVVVAWSQEERKRYGRKEVRE